VPRFARPARDLGAKFRRHNLRGDGHDPRLGRGNRLVAGARVRPRKCRASMPRASRHHRGGHVPWIRATGVATLVARRQASRPSNSPAQHDHYRSSRPNLRVTSELHHRGRARFQYRADRPGRSVGGGSDGASIQDASTGNRRVPSDPAEPRGLCRETRRPTARPKPTELGSSIRSRPAARNVLTAESRLNRSRRGSTRPGARRGRGAALGGSLSRRPVSHRTRTTKSSAG